MASEPRPPRLAVLIDADNASAQIVDGLFEEIAKIGEASVRRIYGDFSSSRSKGWSDRLAQHAIIPQQQFAYVTGKNASDITLVIDAMDLLHSGRFDGFCLVSSDSDFTRLASRIREQGVDVYGFGEQKTPASFRQACRRFIYTENLLPTPSGGHDAASPGRAPLEPLANAAAALRKVVEQMESEDGWVSLGAVGTQIFNLISDFDPRTYGARKLSDLIRKTNAFDIDNPDSGRMRIRIKAPQAASDSVRGPVRQKPTERAPAAAPPPAASKPAQTAPAAPKPLPLTPSDLARAVGSRSRAPRPKTSG
ncbi:MAG: NYN domain-containing protein [Bauldia sp.]|nr:NYN domain-containing protein [Bauldia sp.]MCW5716619.1 NYN domain-containing protein [Bauldia sp.]